MDQADKVANHRCSHRCSLLVRSQRHAIIPRAVDFGREQSNVTVGIGDSIWYHSSKNVVLVRAEPLTSFREMAK